MVRWEFSIHKYCGIKTASKTLPNAGKTTVKQWMKP